MNPHISAVFEAQREAFTRAEFSSYARRLDRLKRLKKALRQRESSLAKALKEDLGKSGLESWMTEFSVIESSIAQAERELKHWMRPKPLNGGLLIWPGNARLIPQPKGQVLILSPWNYPVQLLLVPLVAALAAGNTALLKPSEMVPHVSSELAGLIKDCFAPEEAALFEGGPDTAKALTQLPLNHIFFTGSSRVGQLVYEAAAKQLIPVTLELGGKNPVWMDETAAVSASVRRLFWSKALNAGQTCLAPNLLMAPLALKENIVEAWNACCKDRFGGSLDLAEDLGSIVNSAHFDRLHAFLTQGKPLTKLEVESKTRRILPVLLEVEMEPSEEVFGPILPVQWYVPEESESRWKAMEAQTRKEGPLAAYLFSKSKAKKRAFSYGIRSGGACINDTTLQFTVSDAPFGGVGNSGMGAYHGRYGFEAFSHMRTVVSRKFFFDLPGRFNPGAFPEAWIKKIIAFLMH